MPPHSGQSVELDPKVTPLQDRARATLEERRENKLAALPSYRRMQRNGEV
jgi:hypothetical protein